jgi:hypothetical protein
MKMTMTKYLDNRTDVTSLAGMLGMFLLCLEIAEILLEENAVEKAIEKAEEGLKFILPLHAERIKFYCILTRAYYIQEKVHYILLLLHSLSFLFSSLTKEIKCVLRLSNVLTTIGASIILFMPLFIQLSLSLLSLIRTLVKI